MMREMTLKLRKFSALLFLLTGVAVAQNGFYYGKAEGLNPVNGDVIPLSRAQVRVCALPASGSPCTPIAPIFDIFGNPLTVVGGNFGQITTDNVGNFNFQCNPSGNFLIQVATTGSNTPQLNYQASCGGAGGGGGGAGTVSPNNGTAGAVAQYLTAAGSTTVSPDPNFFDLSNLLTYSGTSGMNITAGPLSVAAPAGQSGYFNLAGNTANQSVKSNTAGFMGPPLSVFTAYALQLPSTGPNGTNTFLSCPPPSSSISLCSFGTVSTSTAFSALTSGTNTAAAMTVGSGASLGPSGTGTVTMTNVQSGASLPSLPCPANSEFSLTGASGNSNTLYRCNTITGGVTYWQQIKPTVETVYAKDYGALFTTIVVSDASTTINSSTITCPNNDCNFPAAAVGWIVWAKNAARGATVCPQSTVLTVNSAQSITVTAANDCTSTNVGNAYLIVGPDDSVTIDNAYQAANSQNGGAPCTILQLPAGFAIVQQPEMNYASGICGQGVAWQVTAIQGAGATATVLIPSPNFNVSAGHGCSGGGVNACFFGVQYEIVQGIKIWGIDTGGGGFSGCTNQVFAENNAAIMYDVVFTEWGSGAGCPGSVGFYNTGNQAEGIIGGSVTFGAFTCQASGQLVNFSNWPCYGSQVGLNILAGATVSSYQNYFGGNFGITIGSGAVFNSNQDTDFGNSSQITINGGRMNMNGYQRGPTSGNTILVNNGGLLTLQNSKLVAANSGIYNGFWAVVNPGAGIRDQDGNTYSGGVVAPGIPSITQSKNCTPAAGSSQACTYASNTTTGNAEIVGVVWNPSSATVSGCSGSVAGALTQQGTTLTTPAVNHAAENVAVFYKAGITGGAETITCTFSASVNSNVGIIEAQGLTPTTASVVDVVQTNTGSGSTISTANLTTTAPSDLVLFIGATNFGGTLSTPPTNSANLSGLTGSTGVFAAARTDTFTAGAFTMSGTLSLNTFDWAVFSIGFKNATPTANFFGQWSSGGNGQVVANLALTSGWSTSSIASTSIVGDAILQQFTITGAGTPAAGPVLTITFPGPGFQRIPVCTMQQVGGNFGDITNPVHVLSKTGAVYTTDTVTFSGTAVAAHTYAFAEECR